MSNAIYIKLNYEEALTAKKDILYSEQGVIRLARIIQNYRRLRSAELKLKIKLYNELKILLKDIHSVKETLPKIEIPHILRHGKQISAGYIPKKESAGERALEIQLEEIQRKLKMLEG